MPRPHFGKYKSAGTRLTSVLTESDYVNFTWVGSPVAGENSTTVVGQVTRHSILACLPGG